MIHMALMMTYDRKNKIPDNNKKKKKEKGVAGWEESLVHLDG